MTWLGWMTKGRCDINFIDMLTAIFEGLVFVGIIFTSIISYLEIRAKIRSIRK